MFPRSTLASRIALVLAAVILPFALLSSWLHAVVSDTDRYVATVAPLAKDRVVQQAAQTKIENVVLNAIDVEGRRFQSAITNAVHNASVAVVEAPGFPDAWATANRSAHAQLIEVLSGEDDRLLDSDGRISVQLNTLVTTVVGILEADGMIDPSQVPELEASFTFVQAGELENARSLYNLLNELGFWLPVLWLLLVAVGIISATDRRQSIRWLGYGSIIGLILLAVGLRVARNQLVGAGLVEDEEFLLAVWNIVLDGLTTAIWVGFCAAVLALGVNWAWEHEA